MRILIFAIALILPFIYYRGLFYIATGVFNKPLLRTKTGLQIHHLHYGIAFVFIASLLILFSGISTYAIALLGLGLGCMLDEFMASLLMPGNRPLELQVYKNSLPKTIILFVVILLLLILLTLFINRF